MSAAVSTSSLPNSFVPDGEPLPTDHTTGRAPPANGQGSVSGSAAEAALTNYQPQAGGLAPDQTRPMDGPAPGSKPADTATPQPRVASNYIDPKVVLERIAGEWEKAGVDPAWAAIIRKPTTWSYDIKPKRPAILKLAEELQRTGEFDILRRQAIRLIRGTSAWGRLVDQKARKEHDPSTGESYEFRRTLADHALTAQFFGWQPDSPSSKADTVDFIINAEPVADCLNPTANGCMDKLIAEARATAAAAAAGVQVTT